MNHLWLIDIVKNWNTWVPQILSFPWTTDRAQTSRNALGSFSKSSSHIQKVNIFDKLGTYDQCFKFVHFHPILIKDLGQGVLDPEDYLDQFISKKGLCISWLWPVPEVCFFCHEFSTSDPIIRWHWHLNVAVIKVVQTIIKRNLARSEDNGGIKWNLKAFNEIESLSRTFWRQLSIYLKAIGVFEQKLRFLLCSPALSCLHTIG